jgi:hypothetical protein
MGVSRQLAYRYTKHGWLKSLGYGYFLRAKDTLTVRGAITSLQHNGVNVHIGGKSALALRGFLHYVRNDRAPLTLYGHKTRNLPAWFGERFPFLLSNETLFADPHAVGERLCVSRLDGDRDALVSCPERAVLELLAQVPSQQTMEEAELIMEGLLGLRPGKMQGLLDACKKPTLKKLFMQTAEKLRLPVLEELVAL